MPAPAKTLRWSSQGDASTVDPHAQNEGFTNAIAGLVSEQLVGGDRKVEHRAQDRRLHGGVQDRVAQPDPADHRHDVFLMSKHWCEKSGVTRPQDFVNKEETYGSRNAMGMGSHRLASSTAPTTRCSRTP